MNLQFFRIWMMLALLLIFLSKYNALYFYWAALFIVVEILNHKTVYKEQGKKWNIIYFIYLVFITLERGFNNFAGYFTRGKSFTINQNFLEVINIAEHIAFAIVICSLLYFYISAFSNKIDNKLNLNIKIILLFTIIGILNEVFQNIYRGKLYYDFSTDSLKDILVNFIGAMVYLLLSSSIFRRKVL